MTGAELEAATALFIEAHRRYQAELAERIEKAEAELEEMCATDVPPGPFLS